ncbi:MAG TPA: hypothetical protein VMW38_18475 [Terriglobia bacterium]|nr:hypothetical protein [Terriglobia bacterium]
MTLSDNAAKYAHTKRRVFSSGIVREDVSAIASAQSRLQSALLIAGIVVIIISGG